MLMLLSHISGYKGPGHAGGLRCCGFLCRVSKTTGSPSFSCTSCCPIGPSTIITTYRGGGKKKYPPRKNGWVLLTRSDDINPK